MPQENLELTLAHLIHLMAGRLSQANNVAIAAEACVNSGNVSAAFQIILKVEEYTFDATNLLNAASVVRRAIQE